jgi:hypothetical protein
VITKETCFGGLQVPISSKGSKDRVQVLVHVSGKVEVAAWEVSEGGRDGEGDFDCGMIGEQLR